MKLTLGSIITCTFEAGKKKKTTIVSRATRKLSGLMAWKALKYSTSAKVRNHSPRQTSHLTPFFFFFYFWFTATSWDEVDAPASVEVQFHIVKMHITNQVLHSKCCWKYEITSQNVRFSQTPHLNLQFLLNSLSFIENVSTLFNWPASPLLFLFTLTALIVHFLAAANKILEATVPYLPITKQPDGHC